MCRKVLTASMVMIVMLLTGCSGVSKIVYRPDIDQGNYLTPADTAKVAKGMTKQQVLYLLGTPMMQDPFGSNTWIYVFRQQPGHQDVKQQTLKLTFDSQDVLKDINNEFPLKESD